MMAKEMVQDSNYQYHLYSSTFALNLYGLNFLLKSRVRIGRALGVRADDHPGNTS